MTPLTRIRYFISYFADDYGLLNTLIFELMGKFFFTRIDNTLKKINTGELFIERQILLIFKFQNKHKNTECLLVLFFFKTTDIYTAGLPDHPN